MCGVGMDGRETNSLVGTIGGSRSKLEPPASDERVAQWRNYLSFACAIGTTAGRVRSQRLVVSLTSCTHAHAHNPAVVADVSDVMPRARVNYLLSARSLFRLVVPLLRSERDVVLDGMIFALSFTNWMVYKVASPLDDHAPRTTVWPCHTRPYPCPPHRPRSPCYPCRPTALL